MFIKMELKLEAGKVFRLELPGTEFEFTSGKAAPTRTPIDCEAGAGLKLRDGDGNLVCYLIGNADLEGTKYCVSIQDDPEDGTTILKVERLPDEDVGTKTIPSAVNEDVKVEDASGTGASSPESPVPVEMEANKIFEQCSSSATGDDADKYGGRQCGHIFRKGENRLFVGNLPNLATHQDIMDVFLEFGQVTAVHWPERQGFFQFEPYCFVSFENPNSARLALIKEEGIFMTLNGRPPESGSIQTPQRCQKF